MKMPYEKWQAGDTGWLVLLGVLVSVSMYGVNVTPNDNLVLGLFTAAAAFGWWHYRMNRKKDWWEEFDRQRRTENHDPL